MQKPIQQKLKVTVIIFAIQMGVKLAPSTTKLESQIVIAYFFNMKNILGI
jgi:hypothetical protein